MSRQYPYRIVVREKTFAFVKRFVGQRLGLGKKTDPMDTTVPTRMVVITHVQTLPMARGIAETSRALGLVAVIERMCSTHGWHIVNVYGVCEACDSEWDRED